jgi:hypothetical protein
MQTSTAYSALFTMDEQAKYCWVKRRLESRIVHNMLRGFAYMPSNWNQDVTS